LLVLEVYTGFESISNRGVESIDRARDIGQFLIGMSGKEPGKHYRITGAHCLSSAGVGIPVCSLLTIEVTGRLKISGL